MRYAMLAIAITSITYTSPSVQLVAAEEAVAKAETVTVFGDGTLTVPGEFKRVPPKSRILEHEFQVKGDDDSSARVTMMASGGGIEPNIKRWQGQFAGGDEDAKGTEKMELGKWKVYIVDNNGSFSERMGGGPFAGGKTIVRKDWGMTGAILAHPEGRLYFVKMVGPQSVVKANRKQFVEMIKSIDK